MGGLLKRFINMIKPSWKMSAYHILTLNRFNKKKLFELFVLDNCHRNRGQNLNHIEIGLLLEKPNNYESSLKMSCHII